MRLEVLDQANQLLKDFLLKEGHKLEESERLELCKAGRIIESILGA